MISKLGIPFTFVFFSTKNAIKINSDMVVQIISFNASTVRNEDLLWRTNMSMVIYCEEGKALRITNTAQNHPFPEAVQTRLREIFDDKYRRFMPPFEYPNYIFSKKKLKSDFWILLKFDRSKWYKCRYRARHNARNKPCKRPFIHPTAP